MNETRAMPARDTTNPMKNHFVSGSSPRQKKCIRTPVKKGDTATMTPTLEAIVYVRAMFSRRKYMQAPVNPANTK